MTPQRDAGNRQVGIEVYVLLLLAEFPIKPNSRTWVSLIRYSRCRLPLKQGGNAAADRAIDRAGLTPSGCRLVPAEVLGLANLRLGPLHLLCWIHGHTSLFILPWYKVDAQKAGQAGTSCLNTLATRGDSRQGIPTMVHGGCIDRGQEEQRERGIGE